MAIWVPFNSVGAGKTLSLLHSTKISCAGSHCDLCAIYASSEGSGESAACAAIGLLYLLKAGHAPGDNWGRAEFGPGGII